MRDLLPPAKSTPTTYDDPQRFSDPEKAPAFGDGGAFPEIAQYLLHMARDRDRPAKPGSKKHNNLVPKILRNEEDEQLQKRIKETTVETKKALEKILNATIKQALDSKFIKYKPSQQSAAYNSGAEERIVRVVETPVDPLEPPKFKHKKLPKPSGPPPVPVVHSPPRPLTVRDQQDWKIPPSISNSKNPKGYAIPLDKRLAADGRGLQDVQINDNFANLSEALYVSEQKAREALAMTSRVQEEMMLKEKERKEKELLALAQKARSQSTGAPAVHVHCEKSMAEDDDDARLQREKIREERRQERKRERRLEAKDAATGKRSKITRDGDRDMSEKVVLGTASTGRGGEVMYDQRLFNQDKGMDSGFATDDQYNVYDKGLLAAQPTLSTLYRPKKQDTDAEMYGGAEDQFNNILKTHRFKPDKAFAGTSEKAAPRDKPVEFEKEADPFGLDQFLTEVKKGKKAMDDKLSSAVHSLLP